METVTIDGNEWRQSVFGDGAEHWYSRSMPYASDGKLSLWVRSEWDPVADWVFWRWSVDDFPGADVPRMYGHPGAEGRESYLRHACQAAVEFAEHLHPQVEAWEVCPDDC